MHRVIFQKRLVTFDADIDNAHDYAGGYICTTLSHSNTFGGISVYQLVHIIKLDREDLAKTSLDRI